MAKGKGKVSDFFEIAERIDAMLDFKEILNEEDYHRAVRKLLKETPQDRDGGGSNRATNLLPYIDELYENGKAKEKIEENRVRKVKDEEDAFRDALRFERRRKLKERLRDEGRTAKNTRPATRNSVRIWRRRGGLQGDIRGIDTKLRRRGVVSLITKSGEMKLREKGISVTYDVKGIRHFKDIRTGRYTRNKL